MQRVLPVFGFLLVLCGALLGALIASAQQPAQPPFAPYTITEQQHQQLTTYLGEVPAKWSVPLLNSLAQWEQAAQAEAAKAKEESKPSGR